jgi:hypothetical protein
MSLSFEQAPDAGAVLRRRQFLRALFFSAGSATLPAWLAACDAGGGDSEAPGSGRGVQGMTGRFANLGPLRDADANGVRTPEGFSTRVVAINGELPQPNGMSASGPQTGGVGNRPWHILNDGGGVIERPEGGWIYVSNSEVPGVGNLSQLGPQFSVLGNLLETFVPGLGGVGVLVFDPDGTIVDSYSILTNTTFNCAGCITPWGTWLSCEEFSGGRVWECDPFASGEGEARPALGLFDHEAIAIDAKRRILYQTEDRSDGRFYRFVPDEADWPASAARPALQSGRLQAMVVGGDGVAAALNAPQPVTWKDIAEPGEPQDQVRDAETSIFDGGEGIWLFRDVVYFSTKNDERIWAYDSVAETIEVIYDLETATPPNDILSGVDNLIVTPQGDILVAEDGGDMQVVVILPSGELKPLLQIVGQDLSEIAGISFTPDGRRMYFTSDRGGRNPAGGYGLGAGMLYELTLPDSV